MEKVKLIQGNPDRAKEISKTFKKLGGVNKNNLSFEYEDTYYYIDNFGFCRCLTEENAKELVAEGKAEIYELPAPKPKYDFKPFDKVLVRASDEDVWRVNFFSNKQSGTRGEYVCIIFSWEQCIPYEGNEALLGTNDNPK